jgi:pilus assembly protein Flp/PilA
MSAIFARFMKDESGATAIEYGLIAALISVALITGATALGNSLNKQFNALSTKLNYTGLYRTVSYPKGPPRGGPFLLRRQYRFQFPEIVSE